MNHKQLPVRARTDLMGRTVLLVEDNFFEARDMQQALQHAGARVLGPFKDATSALRAIATREFSCAILDIQLADGKRFNVANALEDRGVPFLFLTGINPDLVPDEFQDVPFFQKPGELRALLRTTSQLCADRWY